jgi:hypothetical protein
MYLAKDLPPKPIGKGPLEMQPLRNTFEVRTNFKGEFHDVKPKK